MKTSEAISKYNQGELVIKKIHKDISAVKRSELINEYLEKMYGEDEADEIIDLVFEHEFYPVGLNKNE